MGSESGSCDRVERQRIVLVQDIIISSKWYIFSPWYSRKMAHFGVKQLSLTHSLTLSAHDAFL